MSGAITLLPQKHVNNQAVVRLASSTAYVRETISVRELYAALNEHPEIMAVGVVDKDERVVGIVVRRDFLATMARPYAQDVFRHHPVREVMSSTRSFSSDSDIFTVAEEISEEMRRPTVLYYLLTWSGDKFAGVFSSQDMLVYLSAITQNDIELARRLQTRIVRTREISVGSRLELVANSNTAKGVGGDFYKVAQYAPGRWLVALCDVSGKGVAASIITSVLWGMMSIYDFRNGLVPFVKEVNRYLVQTFEAEKFVTAVFIDYDESARQATICDLGHSHLYVFRDSQLRTVRTDQHNLPLGITPDLDPRVNTFRPSPDDLFMLITDGLIEQANLRGEIYSLDCVQQVIRRHATAPVETVSDRLLEDFTRFRGKRPLGDDVTWAIMRFAAQEITL